MTLDSTVQGSFAALRPRPGGPEAIPARSLARPASPTSCDYTDAGRRLAQALAPYRGSDLVMVSLSDGGARIAAKLGEHLHARLDRLLMRGVRSPLQPQLAIGLIVDGPVLHIFRDDTILAGLSEGQFWDACRVEIAELRRERERYLGDDQPLDARGRILVLVDDGLATGHMMRAALSILRSRDPRRIVVAVPVASRLVLDTLRDEADEIVHLGLHNGPDPRSRYPERMPVTRESLAAGALSGRI
jgi:putative phosphoribosyl transferase